MCNPPSIFWGFLWVSFQLALARIPPRGSIWIRCPNHLNWLFSKQKKQRYSNLLMAVKPPQPVTMCPDTQWRKLSLPRAQNCRRGQEFTRSASTSNSLFMNVQHNARITADTETIHLSISYYISHALINKTMWCLNSFNSGSNSFPTQREESTVFRQSIIPSDLEVLTLTITSHSAVNHYNEYHRAQSDKANRITSSAKM